jgi:hypothetical protein
MAVTQADPVPYAPANAVLEIISRRRHRSLPTPIGADVLARASISPSLIPRTLQALKILDLIDGEGNPTLVFEAIRTSPEAEYQRRLEEWLKGAYAEVFAFVDPAKDDEIKIRDAFRSYNPAGQQERMVTLFQGLCAAAGLIPDKPAPASRQRASSPAPSKSATAFTPRQRTLAKRVLAPRFQNAARHPPRGPTADLPAPLAGLLAGLPAEGDSWTTVEREKFLTTFKAVLDFCFPVVTKKAGGDQDATAAQN